MKVFEVKVKGWIGGKQKTVSIMVEATGYDIAAKVSLYMVDIIKIMVMAKVKSISEKENAEMVDSPLRASPYWIIKSKVMKDRESWDTYIAAETAAEAIQSLEDYRNETNAKFCEIVSVTKKEQIKCLAFSSSYTEESVAHHARLKKDGLFASVKVDEYAA